MDFQSIFESRKRDWEENYTGFLQRTSLKDAHPDFRDAVLYSLRAGGKRLRPVIILEMAEMEKIPSEAAMMLATGVECLHTYSLVHDDLPAMDNDDFRRGMPTSHKRYGEDVAILVGDALQSLSFELISAACGGDHVLTYFSRCVGPAGLINGQYLDIKGSPNQSAEYMQNMHRLKTGNLLSACVVLPYIFQQPGINFTEIEQWGLDLGHLFQIVDDILDQTSSTEKLGKTAGKDAAQNKLTYINFFGLEKSRKMANSLCDSLSRAPFFSNHPFFSQLPEYIKNRDK